MTPPNEGKITQVVAINGKVWDARQGFQFTLNPANAMATGICLRLGPTKTVTIPAPAISAIVVEYDTVEAVDAIFTKPTPATT